MSSDSPIVAVENGQTIAVENRMKDWLGRFRYYRDPPDEEKILNWLNAFNDEHRQVAAKVLDEVMVVGEREIQQGYAAALAGLEGWHRTPAQRKGRWFFIGFGGPGESGPAMLRLFREANGLANERHNDLFKSISDLADLRLTAMDHVVFVDDFAGTGDQVTGLWPTVAELVASEASCYLVLTALTGDAERAISEQTELHIRARYVLGADKAVFHAENTTFTDDEKRVVAEYCARADRGNPRGYGGVGVLFVLSHKTPNNALPILYANEEHWRGLFPRYLKAAA